MSLATPLSRVRGLGSARQGTQHWWQQRLTAVALAPLSVWFIISLLNANATDHGAMVLWLRAPLNAVLLLIFIIALFHHAQLGVQVVIEDYVEPEWQKIGCIILIKFLALVSALASSLAVLKVFLGA